MSVCGIVQVVDRNEFASQHRDMSDKVGDWWNFMLANDIAIYSCCKVGSDK